jgi:NAD(P)H-dependent flavin oxidoreductase YrpB (nitropropane dioxygenase family)
MNEHKSYPRIIQGGMGVGVSSWRLARAATRHGALGVVSGSMLDTVIVRRLQDGDAGGHVRRAAAHFPLPQVADEILRRYYKPSGRAPGTPYRQLPMYKARVSAARERVTIFANFVEVWLAREGHDGEIGINLLTKVQMPNLASLYGAMLADVDYVIMGAGIPREIPAVLDAYVDHQPARLRLDVENAGAEPPIELMFSPMDHWPSPTRRLKRPRFLAVVSAASLAANLLRKASGRIDGFVVEGATAGGHNAPPRGPLRLSSNGEPLYGERDVVDLADMRALPVPFWLAGGVGSPTGLAAALAAGAAGIQVGTLFAYADESGIAPDIRQRVLNAVIAGDASVFTDPRASPTGYPFKIVELPETRPALAGRHRVCDLGYLRVAARTASGSLVYRCAAEPVDTYLQKGGTAEQAEGRHCLCNGLTATIGQAQARTDGAEPAIVTSGDDLLALSSFLAGRRHYGAADVVDYLTGAAPRDGGN